MAWGFMVGYNPLTNILLTLWAIQVGLFQRFREENEVDLHEFLKFMVNAGQYSTHGACGNYTSIDTQNPPNSMDSLFSVIFSTNPYT